MAKTPKRREKKKSPKRVTQLHSKSVLVKTSPKKTPMELFLEKSKTMDIRESMKLLEQFMQNQKKELRDLPLRPGQEVGDKTLRTGLGKNVLYNFASRETVLKALESVGLQVRPQLICVLQMTFYDDDVINEKFSRETREKDVIKMINKRKTTSMDQLRNEPNKTIKYNEVYIWDEVKYFTTTYTFNLLQNVSLFVKDKPFFFQLSTSNLKFRVNNETFTYDGAHVVGCVYLPNIDTISVFGTYSFEEEMLALVQRFFKSYATSVKIFPNEFDVSDEWEDAEFNLQGICDAKEPGSCQAYSFIVPFKLAEAGVLDKWNAGQNFAEVIEEIGRVYDSMNEPNVAKFNDLRREVGLLGGKMQQKRRRTFARTHSRRSRRR